MRYGSPTVQALEALKAPEALETMSSAESGWDERIERARALAAEDSAAAGSLTFYASLAGDQRSLCCRPPQSWGPPLGGPIRLKPDLTEPKPDPTDQSPDFFQPVDLDHAPGRWG